MRQRLPYTSLVGALLVLVVAGTIALRIADESVPSRRLPRWDMAEHGYDGVALAAAARDADPLRFVATLHRMSLWPPLFPLVECPVFLICGYEYGVARALMAALFAGAALALYWAGRELGGRSRVAVGSITAALFMASPLVQTHAAVVMLEVPGVLVLAVAVAFYARYRRHRRRSDLTAACLATTVLFFTKYNYAILWLVPAIAGEVWAAAPPGRHTGERLLHALRSTRLSAWRLLLIAYMLFLVTIVATGGWVWELFGQRISVRGLGNPVLVLVLILIARALARPRRSLAAWRGLRTSLDPRARRLVTLVVAPAALWLLVPPHLKDFFLFVGNRSSGIGRFSREALAYYPSALIHDYAPSAAIGLVVLVAALLPVFALHRLSPARRVVVLALLWGLLTTFLHPYKDPRFVFTVAPFVWLSAALTLGTLLDRPMRRVASATRSSLGILLIAAVPLAAVAAGGLDREHLRASFVARTVAAEVRPLVSTIADHAAAADRTVVLGTWNELSPGLLRWHARIRHPRLPAEQLPRDDTCWDAAMDGSGGIEQVIVVGLDRQAPVWNAGFTAENPRLDERRAALAAAARFALAGTESFVDSGYRAEVFVTAVNRSGRPPR
jgi:hypothetical protein